MYFKNRAEAGKKLAAALSEYKSQHIAVVSLGLGSSIVAAQVAMELHSNLFLYVVKGIQLPGEHDDFAGMGSGDIFTFNDVYSTGQIDDMNGEYHGYIEQKRMEASHEIHMLLGKDGELNTELLRHRTIIVVSDGMANAFGLTVIASFFKRVAMDKLIIATPIASVEALDRMHVIGDGVCCLSVAGNYFGTDHYYDDNTRPDIEGVKMIIRNISLNWHKGATLESLP